MEIVIEIPKEFERHYKNDRFSESLVRLKLDAHCLAGNYEKELCDMLFLAFRGAISYREEGGTNGKKRL